MSRLLQKAGIDGRRRMIIVGIGLVLLVLLSLFCYVLLSRSSDSSIASTGTGEVDTASLVLTLTAAPTLSSTQSSDFALAELNGGLHVVMQGAEGHLYHRSLDADGTWSGGEGGEWKWIGQGSPQVAPLLAVVGDRLHVVMQGAEGHLYHRSLDTDGIWSGGEGGEWEWIGQGS